MAQLNAANEQLNEQSEDGVMGEIESGAGLNEKASESERVTTAESDRLSDEDGRDNSSLSNAASSRSSPSSPILPRPLQAAASALSSIAPLPLPPDTPAHNAQQRSFAQVVQEKMMEGSREADEQAAKAEDIVQQEEEKEQQASIEKS